ncbi:hypothetical protein HPB49_025137 [Dermacentor silvarum]|uniref:Uncharacterized protein n=1 Tax=Dermacentor silvarum TaxID=543639 RepID=A0ACB8DSC3_DERSI|nr:hypothetical protein HPB49_025137 [Dermacentor silvarum]
MKIVSAYLAWFISARTFALLESTHESTRLLDLNSSRHGNTLAEASVATYDEHLEDSCTLPWKLSLSAEQVLSDHAFWSLLQCPANLHGCSEELTTCHHPDVFVMTCSCAPNCEVYGDCCWSVVERPEMSAAELPRTSCVSLEAEVTGRQVEYDPRSGMVSLRSEISGRFSLQMVVGCPSSWPQDDVRKACEESDLFQEIFYGIPVTTDRDVTYRNGFCALCNNDNIDGAFWNTKSDKNAAVLLLPGTVSTKPAYHLRPCTDSGAKDTCSREASEVVSRKCESHYAPVRNIDDGTVFRNVYCAQCNGANTSRLSCGPMLYLENKKSVKGNSGGPNLAALFKPVTTTPACRAFYNGRCYIPRSADLREEELSWSSNENSTS